MKNIMSLNSMKNLKKLKTLITLITMKASLNLHFHKFYLYKYLNSWSKFNETSLPII